MEDGLAILEVGKDWMALDLSKVIDISEHPKEKKHSQVKMLIGEQLLTFRYAVDSTVLCKAIANSRGETIAALLKEMANK